MYLWEQSLSRAAVMNRVGALSQLGGITRFEYCDGKAKGVTALRVRTAAGLEFSVLPEKGLDIFEASYKAKSLCWHSPAGVVHPAYYDPRGIEWLKTFPGGLLTSCGSTTAGSPSEDQGEQLGLHGAISNTPAELVNWQEEWKDDELMLTISGKVRESRVFGPNLVKTRTIHAALDGRFIKLADRIENEGQYDCPLMQVYHFNFGFPLLTPKTRIYCPSKHIEGRTAYAARFLDAWDVFEAPNLEKAERVYYHEMAPDAGGEVHVVLVSDDTTHDFGVELIYTAAALPQFIEWKMTAPSHFVLGLEPANCRVDGRKVEREAGTLRVLRSGENEEFNLELRVLDGAREVSEAIENISR